MSAALRLQPFLTESIRQLPAAIASGIVVEALVGADVPIIEVGVAVVGASGLVKFIRIVRTGIVTRDIVPRPDVALARIHYRSVLFHRCTASEVIVADLYENRPLVIAGPHVLKDEVIGPVAGLWAALRATIVKAKMCLLARQSKQYVSHTPRPAAIRMHAWTLASPDKDAANRRYFRRSHP